ncbi:hypothetical protein ACHAWC_011727 [Mediolabrus comicus]
MKLGWTGSAIKSTFKYLASSRSSTNTSSALKNLIPLCFEANLLSSSLMDTIDGQRSTCMRLGLMLLSIKFNSFFLSARSL